jgi:hypothetical protein
MEKQYVVVGFYGMSYRGGDLELAAKSALTEAFDGGTWAKILEDRSLKALYHVTPECALVAVDEEGNWDDDAWVAEPVIEGDEGERKVAGVKWL